MKLIMTLLVRDAEELLRSNLEFHIEQGVDFFVITDNGSVDSTPDIIQDYVRAGVAEMIHEPEDTYSQARWVTRMARLAAARHGADWVINSDDDEFWHAGEGGLKPGLSRAPPDVSAVEVIRRNHPPLEGAEGADALEAMIYRERTSYNHIGHRLLSKVCHRGLADIEVAQGNHAVARAGIPIRPVRADGLAISHYPIRGYEAFARKIRLGGAAYARNTELDWTVGSAWRWLYEVLNQGRLRAWYDQQVLSRAQLDQGLADGSLEVDDFVARALAELKDPTCGAAA